MANDNCRDNLFLRCPKQISDNQASCGCLISDFLPLVEEYDIDLIVILHILKNTTDDIQVEWCHFIDLLKKRWRRFVIFISLKFDTQKKWKKWVYIKTLAFMEWWYCHRQHIVTILAILVLVAILSLNILFLAFIALFALVIYIPLMQVKQDVENYYVIETSHFQKQYVDKNGSHIGSSQSEKCGAVKCSILRSLLENNFPKVERCNLHLSERTVIDQLIGPLSEMDYNIKVVAILLHNRQKKEYEIYE
ncbi:MAG: hypothetical protein MJ000_03835 [Bacteroidales bacterium]|nr:hypothetical protein [Bacteroidales bacterium]